MDTCLDCHEDYAMEELQPYGLCADCQANFDALDAEDALDKLWEM